MNKLNISGTLKKCDYSHSFSLHTYSFQVNYFYFGKEKHWNKINGRTVFSLSTRARSRWRMCMCSCLCVCVRTSNSCKQIFFAQVHFSALSFFALPSSLSHSLKWYTIHMKMSQFSNVIFPWFYNRLTSLDSPLSGCCSNHGAVVTPVPFLVRFTSSILPVSLAPSLVLRWMQIGPTGRPATTVE